MKKSIKIIAYFMIFSVVFLILNANKTEFADTNATIENGTYIIESAKNENFVFDVSQASKRDMGNIQIWKNSNVNQQKFKITRLSDGYYSITSVNSGKVLDVASGSKKSGANVQQYTWNGTDAQKWLITKDSSGNYNFVSKCNNLVLDVLAGKMSNGTNVQVYEKNGTNAQKFKMKKIEEPREETITGTKTIDNGDYVIESSVNNRYVLDVSQASKSNNANVQIWSRTNEKQQIFTVKYLNDGTYSITSKNSGKVLDVLGGAKKSGTNVQQYEWNGTNAQRWIIKEAGNGAYYLYSKSNNLVLDVLAGKMSNGTNVQVYEKNGTNAQKFKFVKATDGTLTQAGNIKTGIYYIASSINENKVLDVAGGSIYNDANVQIWNKDNVMQQAFEIINLNNGFYTIKSYNSQKSLDVAYAGTAPGTNVKQYTYNANDAQKWTINKTADGYYIIGSKCNNLVLDVVGGNMTNGTNVQMYTKNYSNAQKFVIKTAMKFTIDGLDTSKYPGYKDKLVSLRNQHPNWNFEILYTGLNFYDAVNGEARVAARNLVPTSYGGEWINSYSLYDSGWYAASSKAIAYYMDPRNFLDSTNVFQFQDVNRYFYSDKDITSMIKNKVKGTFLEKYAEDLNVACKNQGVNPIYIIARLLQEQGAGGSATINMADSSGKRYYNPFNIGASGNGNAAIIANALSTAKSYGWDTMEKALEGGIGFCKTNWLENFQNTLYQNKFDIDNRNESSLYSHQYMQNLMAAYSEARSMKNAYQNSSKMELDFTFIIPVYENMPVTVSELPSNKKESYPMDYETTGTELYLRSEASASSSIITQFKNAGIKLLSAQRGVGSDWQKVITTDGKIGYVSSKYLKAIDIQTNCKYTAWVKTNDGDGCYVRIGPSTRLDKVTALSENTEVTVINEGTYNNIDGFDWVRVILSSGEQCFMPKKFLRR